MNSMRHMILAIGLVGGLVLHSAYAFDAAAQQNGAATFNERQFREQRLNGEIFSRTELFFGLSKPDGGVVSEEEFQFFVDTEVTPRFPDGLTLLTGDGQFQDSTGAIIQEGSKLLILLYPFNNKSNRAVERIREEYKEAFQQESVLRVNEQSCVSF